jgi:hypothetical protein
MPTSSLSIVSRGLAHSSIGSGPASSSGFGKAAKDTLGRFVAKPMTREEACKILNIEEVPELKHEEVMKVTKLHFDPLFRDLKPWWLRMICLREVLSTFSQRSTLQKNNWCRTSLLVLTNPNSTLALSKLRKAQKIKERRQSRQKRSKKKGVINQND